MQCPGHRRVRMVAVSCGGNAWCADEGGHERDAQCSNDSEYSYAYGFVVSEVMGLFVFLVFKEWDAGKPMFSFARVDCFVCRASNENPVEFLRFNECWGSILF